MSDTSELATNLHRLSTVLGRVADATLQDAYGYGMSQFKILWMLRTHEGGVLQTNIADWLNQTEAAVSRQVALLQEEGLIHKEIDPQNRRNHCIVLTSAGKVFAEKAMDLLVKEYKPYFSALSEAEQDSLNTMLEKVFYKICDMNNKEK